MQEATGEIMGLRPRQQYVKLLTQVEFTRYMEPLLSRKRFGLHPFSL